MIWDAKAKTMLPSGSKMPSGLMGYMRWDRLIGELRRAGKFADNEKVTHLEITEQGIRFRTETKG